MVTTGGPTAGDAEVETAADGTREGEAGDDGDCERVGVIDAVAADDFAPDAPPPWHPETNTAAATARSGKRRPR